MPTRFLTAEFGTTALATVGYRLHNGTTGVTGSRITAGIAEVGSALVSPPGLYGALVTIAADFAGGILWDDGQDPLTYAFEAVNEAAAGDAPTAVEIRQELDSNSTQLAKLGTPAATLAADLAAVAVQAAAIKLITDRINGALELDGAVYRLTANALELAPGAAAVWAGADVDGYTAEAALKLILAVLTGKLSGAGTATEVIRAADDSKARVTATVTAEGNRTAVILDATG